MGRLRPRHIHISGIEGDITSPPNGVAVEFASSQEMLTVVQQNLRIN